LSQSVETEHPWNCPFFFVSPLDGRGRYTSAMNGNDNEQWMDSVFEAALHGFMMQRCERAYIHELRDGLQGIAVSIDALARFAEGKASASVSGERIASLGKRALQTHDQGIRAVVQQLVLQRDAPVAVEFGDSLRQIAKLLRNDAAARDVSIRVDLDGGAVHGTVRESRLRLVLLCLSVHAIDALRGAQLTIAASAASNNRKAMIQFAFPLASIERKDAWIATFDAVHVDDACDNSSWMLRAIQQIIRADGGWLESGRESIAGQDCRVVSVRYEAADAVNDVPPAA
jgi:hypothetical protein